MAAAGPGAAAGRRCAGRAGRVCATPEPDDDPFHLESTTILVPEDAHMVIETFESGILRRCLSRISWACWLTAILAAGAANQGLGQEKGAAGLNLMPLPRSITAGTGALNLNAHFSSGFSGQHDARID